MNTFSDYQLPTTLADSLAKQNFIEPTEIQRKSFPFLFEGKDLMACSQTGSGKTAAYLIPMVKQILEDPDNNNGLVLAPTRELAMQIADFLKGLLQGQKLNMALLVGGADIRKQFKQLQKKNAVIVATPGRLIDHLKRNTVQIHKTNLLVIDEGDRMIDMGFSDQLQQILKQLPKDRQTSFFTATLDSKVQKLANQYLRNPEKLIINNSTPVSEIKQSVIEVELEHKDECVLNEIAKREGSVIVFLKTKYRVDRLKDYLAEYGLPVDAIHGGKTQGQRNRTIKGFKSQKTRILCATDVAARGLDISHIEHVINFDLPMQDEDYIHRIGRTGRNGASGEAITFVTNREQYTWNRLAKKYGIDDCLFDIKKKPRGKKSGGGLSVRKSSSRSDRSKDSSSFEDRFGNKPFKGKSSGKPKFGKKKFRDEDEFSQKPKFGKKKFRDEDEFSQKPRKKNAKKSGWNPLEGDGFDSDRPRKSSKKKSFSKSSGKKAFGKKKSSGNSKVNGRPAKKNSRKSFSKKKSSR